MATFKFRQLVNSPLANIRTAKLGVNAATTLGSVDVGKSVKLDDEDNYVVCADGDYIDGIVVAVSSGGTVGLANLGSVQLNREIQVQVAANQSGNVAVGEFLVAGTPLAIGVAGLAQVKNIAAPANEAALVLAYGQPNWRVLSIVSGTGAAGDTILMERF
jgi:hypothetical protein